MSAGTVDVLNAMDDALALLRGEWSCETATVALEDARAAVSELIEAVRPAITEEGMDQAELDRLREAFALVGGVK